MKLPLAGSSYTTRALAASAQQSMNLYAETIEDPSGSGKATKILRGTPGIHLLVNITTHAGNVRGLWSGGGKCFVAVGSWLYEIDNTGATVVRAGNPSQFLDPSGNPNSDTYPVQMFGNGNQLGAVNAGYFYYDNGTGLVLARFQISGVVTVSISGVPRAVLTLTSGDRFTAAMAGRAVFISGQPYLVDTFDSTTQVTLTAASFPGSGSGTVSTFFFQVWWVSGTVFTAGMVGRPIVINGVSYTVKELVSQYTLNLADGESAGQQTAVAYSAVQTNLVYSAEGGDPVTALTGAYEDSQAYVQRPPGGSPDLGRQVNFSAVNDFTNWRGLDFFQKESTPDYIQSVFADRGQIVVFGVSGSEFWRNDLNTGRPVRLDGAAIKEGSAARYAVVSMQEHIYFIGGSPGGGPVAYRIDGYTPTRISTHAIEEAWATNSEFIGLAVGWWYLDEGHSCWVICLPGNASSWVYDSTDKYWHERKGAIGSPVVFSTYRPWHHTYIPEWSSTDGDLNGLHIVGDYNSGKVFIMSSAYYDDEGVDVIRVRDLPYIYGGAGKRVYVGRVDLDMGTGLIPSGTEPTVGLSWSDDNGKTFSTPEASGFGAVGETNKRVFWIAQGSAEVSRIPRLSITGQAQVTLIDLQAEVEIGDS